MKLQDSFLINASKEDVWEVFMDAKKLGSCVPGCKEINSITPTQYEAMMEVKIQFMKLNFQAKGELKNPVEYKSFEVEMVGKPLALAGLFRNQLIITMEEVDSQTVKINYDMNLQMTGRLASLGDVLLKGTIKKTADEFAQNVQQLFIEH